MALCAWIAGATGYTGREVVRQWAELGHKTHAHVRPDSSRRAEWTSRFEGWGATVECSPWSPEALTAHLALLEPTHVFALLGTTAKRTARERREGQTLTGYEQVDYGLTVMLLKAAQVLPKPPRFVYLSSLGVNGVTTNAYLKARWRVEEQLRASDVPYTIARPSFITGSNRDEFRPTERVAAVLSDGLFGGLAAIGVKRPRDQWGSVRNDQLARALIAAAVDPECERALLTSRDLARSLRGSEARDPSL